MLGMEHAQQLIFLDHKKSGWRDGGGRAHPEGLARHASLAQKIARAEHRDDGFFSGPIHHRQFDAALLNVHHIVRCIAL
jgi:hypothetical protein